MSVAEELVEAALSAARGSDVRAAERALDRLVVGTGAPDGVAAVDTALVTRLVGQLGRLWPRGWQPIDVARIIERRTAPRPYRLLVTALAAERRSHPVAQPWWDEQLRSLSASPWWDGAGPDLAGWAAREGVDRMTALRDAVDVLAVLTALPPIAMLRPPPGAAPARAGRPAGSGSGSGARMLDRVRALLSKAESTEFPHEAEAFTAKAQELMARHSIDEALLGAGTGPSADGPDGIRLPTEPPYPGPKALLVHEVAGANSCAAVWSDDLGFVTVLGYPADLAAVEVLYSSLLVQATVAMLRGRAERVETLFPGTTRARLTVRDTEGWSSGTAAADRASLDPSRPDRQVRDRRSHARD